MIRAARKSWGAVAVLPMVGIAACHDAAPTSPPEVPPTLRLVTGAAFADTVLAQLPDTAVVVEVRNTHGEPAPGAVVQFEAGPSIDTARAAVPALYVCRATVVLCGPGVGGDGSLVGGTTVAVDTADATGRARARVRLGTVAGRVGLRVAVPAFSLRDSLAFTVRPGAAARVRLAFADTLLSVGGQATFGAAAFDRWGNRRDDAPALIAADGGGTVSFEAGGGVVSARDVGTAYLFARVGAVVDSAAVRVRPTGRIVGYDGFASALRMIDFDGGNSRTLLDGVAPPDVGGTSPQFDPSRSGLSFLVGSSFGIGARAAVVDTTGANRRDFGPAFDRPNVLAARRLGDGTVRFVARRISPTTGQTIAVSLWTADASGTLTEGRALPNAEISQGLADISPDGSRVAYVAVVSPPATFPTELRVTDVATGRTTAVETYATAPRWSPDGSRLAFVATPTPGRFAGAYSGRLAVTNADGTGRVALASTFLFQAGLAWSPSGAYLLGLAVSPSPSDTPAYRAVRVRDGASVLFSIRDRAAAAAGQPGPPVGLRTPDWR